MAESGPDPLFTGPPLGFISSCSHPLWVVCPPTSQPLAPNLQLAGKTSDLQLILVDFQGQAETACGENRDSPLTQTGKFLRRSVKSGVKLSQPFLSLCAVCVLQGQELP